MKVTGIIIKNAITILNEVSSLRCFALSLRSFRISALDLFFFTDNPPRLKQVQVDPSTPQIEVELGVTDSRSGGSFLLLSTICSLCPTEER